MGDNKSKYSAETAFGEVKTNVLVELSAAFKGNDDKITKLRDKIIASRGVQAKPSHAKRGMKSGKF